MEGLLKQSSRSQGRNTASRTKVSTSHTGCSESRGDLRKPQTPPLSCSLQKLKPMLWGMLASCPRGQGTPPQSIYHYLPLCVMNAPALLPRCQHQAIQKRTLEKPEAELRVLLLLPGWRHMPANPQFPRLCNGQVGGKSSLGGHTTFTGTHSKQWGSMTDHPGHRKGSGCLRAP